LVVTVSPSATVRDKLLEAVCPVLVTSTLKLLVPVAVGIPVITPTEDRLRPSGRLPLRMDHE
jgi:hypothetical protein